MSSLANKVSFIYKELLYIPTMKKTILPIILFMALAISISGCYAGPKYSPELKESFVLAKDWKEAREDIESNGGKIRHIFPDKNILIGEISVSFKSKNIRKVYGEDSVVPSNVGSEFLSWKRMLEYRNIPLEEKLANIPDVEPIYDDMVLIEKPSLTDLNIFPLRIYGGEATDTSSFYIGDIDVNVIFPESNENSSNSEDWTDIEIQEVKDEILNSMDWWTLREPDSHLAFFYYYEERIPVDIEPIEHESYYDWEWINDIMLNMGYGPEQYPPTPLVYDYLNYQRSSDGCDWGFVVFVVDSSNDVDGMFADGKFAYTVVSTGGGGPYMVMTYDNQNYGIENMDVVTAHETGHIFGATDQYGSCSCSNQVGYLYYENQNCINSCLIDENSIMGNGNIITAFANGLVDYYARGQVGWQDTDGDDILDIEDTTPSLNLTHEQNDSEFLFIGDSWINIFPEVNPYYNDISINNIENVEYRYQFMEDPWTGWFSANPSDGLFDYGQEFYDFLISGFPGGNYVFQTRAINNVGNPTPEEEYPEDTVTITGFPPMCYETDGGYNIYVKGYNEDEFGTYEDTCQDSETLVEYYCGVEGYTEVDIVDCRFGCYNGACKTGGIKKFNILIAGGDEIQ